MDLPHLRNRKAEGRKLSMVTCYDAWSARLLAESPVDVLLVGDSAAMVQFGHRDTLPATVDEMAGLVAAVRRGAPAKPIVGDLPFLSYRGSRADDVAAAGRLMRAGADGVKLEGADDHNVDLVAHLVRSGIPVMGHLGLTPQSVHALGGWKVQGRSAADAQAIRDGAHRLEAAGCCALVLECVPTALAAEIAARLAIPVIGIGAGAGCDGQVLVLHDLLGLTVGHRPRFVRTYLDGAALVGDAVARFHADVLAGTFPGPAESYS